MDMNAHGDGTRLTILLDETPPAAVCSLVVQTLTENANALGLYVRDGQLVLIRSREDGTPHILDATRDHVMALVVATVAFMRGGSGSAKHIPPPPYVISGIRGAGQWPFPRLAAVSAIPLLRSDGTVSADPGYDPTTGYFFDCPSDLGDHMRPDPTADDVATARTTLLDMLGDFPFADQASRANALGLVLTPFLRILIDAPTPLFVVQGTSPGEGKSLLATTAGLVGTGSTPAIITEP